MTNIASGNQEFANSLIGNANGKINAKHITFYQTYSGLGLLISKAHVDSYLPIANNGSSSIPKPDLKFPSSKSNCTDLNKWQVISVTWSNKRENLSNCLIHGPREKRCSPIGIFENPTFLVQSPNFDASTQIPYSLGRY